MRRIHVNQHRIRSNAKRHAEDREPVFSIKTWQTNDYANRIGLVVDGRLVAAFVYSPDKPLSCGAKVWCEVDDTVKLEVT